MSQVLLQFAIQTLCPLWHWNSKITLLARQNNTIASQSLSVCSGRGWGQNKAKASSLNTANMKYLPRKSNIYFPYVNNEDESVGITTSWTYLRQYEHICGAATWPTKQGQDCRLSHWSCKSLIDSRVIDQSFKTKHVQVFCLHYCVRPL